MRLKLGKGLIITVIYNRMNWCLLVCLQSGSNENFLSNPLSVGTTKYVNAPCKTSGLFLSAVETLRIMLAVVEENPLSLLAVVA